MSVLGPTIVQLQERRTETGANPWRFLESLDARNPEDAELLRRTRGKELEVLRNLILSSRVTLLYAFSGNGKSSLINAGIMPAFHRSGYAVARTRPRPALSVSNPSQAFKDCLLAEFWLPPKPSIDEVLLTKARASLAEIPAHIRETWEPIVTKASEIIKNAPAGERNSEFLRHVGSHMALPLPEFVEEVQRWVGTDTPILIILDQFEELFVHYYNTPEMAQFITELGQIYTSERLRVKLLFSMREDWVGSMVELRQAIPDVFASCFKLEPLRVSEALPAITESPRRCGVSFEKNLPERILTDLSSFYSVLQKQSFALVHLTPSGEKDPYIELPALQVLMEQLWNSSDLTAGTIPSTSYERLAPHGTSNPAQYVLQTYLSACLHSMSVADRESGKTDFADLRTDLLYLLTDRSAHRRAVSNFSLLAEVNQIRAAINIPNANSLLTSREIERAINPLIESKLVRPIAALGGTWRYELAHDFLVRSVVELWNRLDRRRAEEVVRLNERQQDEHKRFASLARLGTSVTYLMYALAGISLLSVAFIPSYWLLAGEYPDVFIRLLCLSAPSALLLAGIFLRSKQAACLALAASIGTLGLPATMDFFDPPWSGYLAHLVVVVIFLFPGTVEWASEIPETRERKVIWSKVAAACMNYCYILALMMFWFYLDVASHYSGQPLLWAVAAVWVLSQSVSIVWRRSSIGSLVYGLVLQPLDSQKYRVWAREAVSQGLALGFAVINWIFLLQMRFSHFSTRVFVLAHLLVLFGLVMANLNSKDPQGFLDRLMGTEIVERKRGNGDGGSIPASAPPLRIPLFRKESSNVPSQKSEA